MVSRLETLTVVAAVFMVALSSAEAHSRSSQGDRPGILGVHVEPLTDELRDFFGLPENAGVLVSKVRQDSAAAKAGVKVGDAIIAVNGKKVDSPAEVISRVYENAGGAGVPIEIIRNKQALVLKADLPEAQERAKHLPDFNVNIDWRAVTSNISERLQDLEERVRKLEERNR